MSYLNKKNIIKKFLNYLNYKKKTNSKLLNVILK